MMEWRCNMFGAVSCLVTIGALFSLGLMPRETAFYVAQPAMKVSSSTQPGIPVISHTRTTPQMVVAAANIPSVPSADDGAPEARSEVLPTVPNFFTAGIVAGIAMLGGYIFGRFFQGDVAMAAYQSEFASGGRYTIYLKAAADDVDATQKLAALKKEAQEKMEAALEATATKFNSVRTGRANPALLDRVRVEYYGSLTPLKQVAGISIPDASTIVISPFDRSSINAIEKAIGGADLGLTPSNDGEKIRIKVPPLTEDRRKEMVKSVSKMGEEGKVAVRNIRRDILKSADKLKLSEDAEAGFKDDVQKMTDKFIKKVGDMIDAKEKDLTTV